MRAKDWARNIQTMGYCYFSSFRRFSRCLFGALLLVSSCYTNADARYPLEPVDTSSPRATLTGFIGELDDVWALFRDEYWGSPDYELYKDITSRAGRVLSNPAVRNSVPHRTATHG
jgi:hypothetical protein